MTLLLVLLLAALVMTQMRVPHRWALVAVVTLIMGTVTLLPSW